ncbi:SusC/RagA family TonB-linked outer membrane protein [Alistipes sp. kh20]|uniref:SusC/RagA family TonB-linked outer membrane protein n=1 Tax=Alistipes montrealensis TaxID=2834113 RepID=UPI001BCB7D64|nr:SusC/RagA family TonB-linked outer membrane protein [Alistipes montrealensis]MBS4765705.1 SusC/RagA family TonB-linked outer membrane protein [Alistipes montrealensis]
MQRILQHFSRALRLLLLVGSLCSAAITAQAQGGGDPVNLNATLSVTLAEKPVAAVLDDITKKTGIKFAYDPEDIRRLPAVSGEFKKASVHELLDKCIAGSTFKYAIENNVVLVYDSTVKMRKFTVSGTVFDTNKAVLPGASVILKGGGGQGVSTDEKGRFSFTFSTKTSPAVLEVGFLGMETQQVIMTGSANGMKVTLKEGGTRIDDVVVNGMFTRNKNTYTGSVTSVKGEDLVAISNTNLMSALSAVTPGMVVVQNNALGSNPNAIPEILIRGSNSIATSAEQKAYNNPLIILDGAEITMEELYDLDMYEIERIDVLKDAQASIVYGDRAANGVIVIERQQVTDSKPRLSYNFVPELSIPDLSSMNLCNAAQKLELERLAGLYSKSDGSMDNAYAYKLQNVRRGVNTDWISAPLRVPFGQTHSLALSGRAQKIDYRTSLRFSDKYGVMKGDNRRNYSINFSIGYHAREKLTLRYTANYTLTDAKDSPYGSFSAYTKLNPYESPYDEYGELVKAFQFIPGETSTTSEGYQVNPLYNATLSSFSTTRNQALRNTLDAKWYVTKDFYVSGQFNIDIKSSQSDKYTSPDDASFLGTTDPAKRGSYQLGTGKAFNYDGKIVLNYSRNIGQEGSGFVVNAGSDIQHTNATTSYVTAMGFLKDNLSDIKYALGYDTSKLPGGTETLLAKVGFFASGNIYFRNRYFADVSFRTSGSSAYGKDNRFTPMWSFGLGWNLHKEKFLENVKWIDVLRLKWSWGYNGQTTGNPYQAITTYKYDNSNIYYTGAGTVPIRMGNPELKWQRVLKNNFGINLTLFKERLIVSFDYFRNTTKDQLMTIPLPASTGAEDITVNFGENQNFGYDFSVAGKVIQTRNWAWTTVVNGSHVKDRINRISNTLKQTSYQIDEGSPLRLRFREGGSQYDIYAVRSAGIDPVSGQEIFIKQNGEETFKYDPNDEVVVGNTQPKLQGTWLNTLRYKGWSLNFVFSYTFGGDTYNKTLWEKVEDIDPRYNVDERAFTDRWKNPGDLSRYLAIKENKKVDSYSSERFVERLNELWLSSATLTYEFQSKFLRRIGFKRLAVGVGVTDLVRFSTVKYERGTSYPYCRTINLTLRPTF